MIMLCRHGNQPAFCIPCHKEFEHHRDILEKMREQRKRELEERRQQEKTEKD